MARQRLGQHFLSSTWRERVARAVLSPFNPQGDARPSVWIEIGAGHGEMTGLLAQHASCVVAIELDASLIPGLRDATAALANVRVAPGDVLEQDFAALAEGRHFRAYGNLPYYITSPILHRLFDYAALLDAAFLVMQLEVAARIAASPGRREYGYLSAFVQYYARPKILLRIPPGAFQPRPKVESALIALYPPGERAHLAISDERAFLQFLKDCFTQKRKILRNNLRPLVGSAAERIMESSGIAPGARAEQLNLQQFAQLFAVCKDRARA